VCANAGLGRRRGYVAYTRHERSLTVVADSGLLRQDLLERGEAATPERIRAHFMQASDRSDRDGLNASDLLPGCREKWLRTGRIVAAGLDRAREAVHEVVRAVRETVAPRQQQPRQHRGRGMRL
jgi:hypothetical protein